MPSDLEGIRVLAISVGADLIGAVVDGASALGAAVTRLDHALDSSSGVSIATAVDAAISAHGVPGLVLLNVIPESVMNAAPIVDLSEQAWRNGVQAGLLTTIRVLQALGGHLKANGGAVVFVAPSMSLVGAAHMVALSTLLEGQRGLMKSVARQWGSAGVTLNWIAVAPRTLAPFDDVTLASKPDAVTVALGRPPLPREAVGPLLSYLVSQGGRSMTGATLMLDGGEWMVP